MRIRDGVLSSDRAHRRAGGRSRQQQGQAADQDEQLPVSTARVENGAALEKSRGSVDNVAHRIRIRRSVEAGDVADEPRPLCPRAEREEHALLAHSAVAEEGGDGLQPDHLCFPAEVLDVVKYHRELLARVHVDAQLLEETVKRLTRVTHGYRIVLVADRRPQRDGVRRLYFGPYIYIFADGLSCDSTSSCGARGVVWCVGALLLGASAQGL